MGRGRPRHPDVLTPAEWRVVNALRHGLTNGGIGRRLGITRDAVKFHVSNAIGKLSLGTRAELSRWRGAPLGSPQRSIPPTMAQEPTLRRIGQVSRQVSNLPEAVAWYRDTLGLRHLYTFGDLAFFDCDGLRLFLSGSAEGSATGGDSVLYFVTDDIEGAYDRLTSRGVRFRGAPHVVHRHDSGVEEWMAFFEDLDGKLLALMSQVSR